MIKEIIFNLVIIMIFSLGIYLQIRNAKISTFKLKVLYLDHEYLNRIRVNNIEKYVTLNMKTAFMMTDEMPTHNKMIFSFKRIKYENWIRKDLIEERINYDS
jgi:hypothetical protein